MISYDPALLTVGEIIIIVTIHFYLRSRITQYIIFPLTLSGNAEEAGLCEAIWSRGG